MAPTFVAIHNIKTYKNAISKCCPLFLYIAHTCPYSGMLFSTYITYEPRTMYDSAIYARVCRNAIQYDIAVHEIGNGIC